MLGEHKRKTLFSVNLIMYNTVEFAFSPSTHTFLLTHYKRLDLQSLKSLACGF